MNGIDPDLLSRQRAKNTISLVVVPMIFRSFVYGALIGASIVAIIWLAMT